MSRLGIVVIGRNEGERLARCLDSVKDVRPLVYVDSGSADDSVTRARAGGADVVELDPAIPFSAARARNAGFEHLRKAFPDVAWVGFVDGDCELAEGWLEAAVAHLSANPATAIACGFRREAQPRASLYNRLCDIEWRQGGVGVIASCGGDFVARASAFAAVGGFNATVVAGEEPELCFRLRERGFEIVRIDVTMTRHDASMTRFAQWWRRMERAGLAAAQGMALHGSSRSRYNLRRCLRPWTWAVVLPFMVAIGIALSGLGAGSLLLIYPLQIGRVTRSFLRHGLSPSDAVLYASACLVASFPQVMGQVSFWLRRWHGELPGIVEYKFGAQRG